MMRRWRVKRMCNNCPFDTKGPGLKLRKSLQSGRWRGILTALREGNYFPCHDTTEYDDEGEVRNGSGLVCAGSIDWQRKHGASSAYVRLCEYREKRKT